LDGKREGRALRLGDRGYIALVMAMKSILYGLAALSKVAMMTVDDGTIISLNL
jgi:hypothetical protein